MERRVEAELSGFELSRERACLCVHVCGRGVYRLPPLVRVAK